MLDHAFRAVDRVLDEVGEGNLRSPRALAKLGAREIRRSELSALDGSLSAHITFAITRAHGVRNDPPDSDRPASTAPPTRPISDA